MLESTESKQVPAHRTTSIVRASCLKIDRIININTRKGLSTSIPPASPNPAPRLCRQSALLHRHARPILSTRMSTLSRSNLTRRARKAGRYIEGRIAEEEVPWSEQQRHGLGGHDRIVLWRREVGNAKCMPEHDVFIVDLFIRGGLDPLWETH